MSRFEHNLPAILNPVGDICIEVTIPAHPDYVSLFIRAVRQLENNRLYRRDEVLGADVKIVQEQWRNRTVTPLIESLASGTGICGVDGECLAYPPFAGFISFTPQNPYTEPDLVPDGYELPPFYVNGKDAEHTLPNYENGDVIVNFGAINLDVGFGLENAPQIVLCLEGSGVVELKLLAIAQGGVVVLTVDNPPDIFDILAGILSDGLLIVDLNQDIISLPPETATEIIQELTIETEGEHNVYITFLPILDDSLIPLRFGGGLRAVDLCGNIRPCGMPAPEPPPPLDGVTELKPEFQFTADCGMEYRLRDQEENIVQDWQAVPGWVDNAALCFGVGNMATKDDIRDGIYEAFNRLALQVASGRFTDIVVGEDGEVSEPVEDGEGAIPVDDPETTEINEALEARCGGAIALAAKLDKILLDMHTWFASGTINDQMAEDRLVLLYGFEQANANVFAQAWYGVYINSSGTVDLNNTVLDELFFCKGANLTTFARYIYEEHATAAEVPILEVFAENLTEEQISLWFTDGTTIPSKAYETYGCTKIDDEQIILDMSTAEVPSILTSGTWKANHRFRGICQGTFTDTDNPTILRDTFWEIDTASGVKTFRNSTLFSGGTITGASTAAQIPYEETHVYNVIVQKGNSDNQTTVSVNNVPFNLPNTTGILTIDITDLGEIDV